jgi:pyruvate dehydrogenase E1 component alpha subunit
MIFEKYNPLEEKRFQIMDENGSIVNPDFMPDLDEKTITRMLKTMLRAREIDTKLLMYQRQGRMLTYAPNIGQEAAAVGSIAVLNKEDWMVPAYRELGALIWRGMPLDKMLLYWYGNEKGSRIPEDIKILPVAVPIASQLLHAVGISWASKLKGASEVTMTYMGDGATSQGDFNEALNWASVFQTPVVFICQNNQFAISMPRSKQTVARTLAQKSLAFGMPGIQVDGNDIFAVYAASKEAAERARNGGGPSLIEAYTYRMGAHTTSDDPKRYRSDEEVEAWKLKDPIDRLAKYCFDKRLVTEEEMTAWRKEYASEMDSTFKQVEQSAEMDPEEIFNSMYSELTPQLKEELDDYRRYLAWQERSEQ